MTPVSGTGRTYPPAGPRRPARHVGGRSPAVQVSARPAGRARTGAVFLVLVSLLANIYYAVSIAQHIQATLGDRSNTLYQSNFEQLLVTTFLRVAVAAAAFWLVILHQRAGSIMAIVLGLVTVLLFTVSVTGPTDAGPALAPAWLHALGLLSAAGMLLGGGLALRPRSLHT